MEDGHDVRSGSIFPVSALNTICPNYSHERKSLVSAPNGKFVPFADSCSAAIDILSGGLVLTCPPLRSAIHWPQSNWPRIGATITGDGGLACDLSAASDPLCREIGPVADGFRRSCSRHHPARTQPVEGSRNIQPLPVQGPRCRTLCSSAVPRAEWAILIAIDWGSGCRSDRSASTSTSGKWAARAARLFEHFLFRGNGEFC